MYKVKDLKEFLENVDDEAEILIDVFIETSLSKKGYIQDFKPTDAKGTIIDARHPHPEYVILIHDNEPFCDLGEIF